MLQAIGGGGGVVNRGTFSFPLLLTIDDQVT